MTEAASSSRINAILFALLALVVLLFIWFWISNPSRSVGDTTGTIEAVTVRASSEGNVGGERTAMIRLADGTLIQAHVVTPTNVHSGERAKVHISEQVLSGTRTYEVLEAPEVH
jgi:HAMP domain-containing protein